MGQFTPLVWDDVRGVPRQLDPADELQIQGGLSVIGPLGFYGQTGLPVRPQVDGGLGNSLSQLFAALAALGLIADGRSNSWSADLGRLDSLAGLGPYETGRLIIGSIGGWMNLDQPAYEPGVIQAVTAHAGPAEVSAAGATLRQLAYSPVLSYGPAPANGRAMPGALWFDSGINRLKVWSGSAWQKVDPAGLDALLADLTGLQAGQLVVSDGRDGLTILRAPAGPAAGLSAMTDSHGAMALVRLLTIGVAAPWANGTSAHAAGRPAGLEHALWFNPSPNNESLSVWDEAAQKWKGVPLDSPLLQDLADLRTTVAEGDLFTYRGGRLERLPIGSTSQSLVSTGTMARWHSRFVSSIGEPAGTLDGDLWLDGSDALWLRSNGSWRDLQQTVRHQAPNGGGGMVLAGAAVVHDGNQWRLADQTTARDALVAIALQPAAGGAPLSAAVGGVVQLSAAQWSAVIDTAEAHAPGAGLMAGRHYFLSATIAGQLTTKPAAGQELPIGVALSASQLLLRPVPPLSDRPALAGQTPLAPANPQAGTLWWDPGSSILMVYAVDATGHGGWEPAVNPAGIGGGAGGGTTPGGGTTSVVGVEAIDWVADPLAAALRFSLSDGTTDTVRLRGSNGARVTMADNRTLVIDAGGLHVGLTAIDGGRFSP